MPLRDKSLTFIVPFRSRTTTANWSLVCRLLSQTLASIRNSCDSRYTVIVVGHDEPGLSLGDDRIRFISASFPAPLPKTLLMSDKERIFHWHTDKGRKILLGIQAARNLESMYIMPIDADDLISDRLVEFCLECSNPNGYYIEYGYQMDKLTDTWLFRRRQFFRECGTGSILKTDKAPFPEVLDLSLDLEDYYIRRYVNHAYIPSCMEGLGAPLKRIPFPAAIYRFHGENIYASSLRNQGGRLRRAVRLLVKGVHVTDSLRREYMIP